MLGAYLPSFATKLLPTVPEKQLKDDLSTGPMGTVELGDSLILCCFIITSDTFHIDSGTCFSGVWVLTTSSKYSQNTIFISLIQWWKNVKVFRENEKVVLLEV